MSPKATLVLAALCAFSADVTGFAQQQQQGRPEQRGGQSVQQPGVPQRGATERRNSEPARGVTQQQRSAPEQRGRAEQSVRPVPRETQQPYRAHPPGTHPHGAIVRPHAVRVLPPRAVIQGRTSWQHWRHPEFTRPLYYWDWGAIGTVTCTAEDSYGDQYPVTQTAGPGFGLPNMTPVEDAALDQRKRATSARARRPGSPDRRGRTALRY